MTVSETIALRSPLTQAHAGELRPLLQQAHGDVLLDLAGVRSLDAVCLGLPVGTRQRAQRRGSAFGLVNVEAPVQQHLTELGLWTALAVEPEL